MNQEQNLSEKETVFTGVARAVYIDRFGGCQI